VPRHDGGKLYKHYADGRPATPWPGTGPWYEAAAADGPRPRSTDDRPLTYSLARIHRSARWVGLESVLRVR
jgi:hypothetical protein